MTVGRDVVQVWRDEHVVVVYKPSGMLAVPASGRKETNVLAQVGRWVGKTFAVHRLDEGTSGLMMVARTERAQQGLKAQLEEHTVTRRYLAMVLGRLKNSPMTVRSSLVRNRGDGKRGSGSEKAPGAKSAVTHLSTLEVMGRISLVQAELETGRTHQVRIHLTELRCPLLGDGLYGGRKAAALAPRLALHASVLGFRHPVTGAQLRFEAPLADDLEVLKRAIQTDGPRPVRKARR